VRTVDGRLTGFPRRNSAAMEAINHIINVADSMFERFVQQVMPINSTALAAGIIILSVLFTAPTRPAQIVGTIALASIGVLVLFAANYAMVLFVFWCGLVGVVRSRKRSALLQNKLDKLSRTVHELELAESRRLFELLNSSSRSVSRKPQQDTPSITPSEKPPAHRQTEPSVGDAADPGLRGLGSPPDPH
jgi:hypothetical protein